MCETLLGIYLEIYFEGVDWQEVTQNCAKRKSKGCPRDCRLSHDTHGSPADFNPILSFTVVKKQQENFVLMLGLGQATTGHNSVQDFLTV